jgi:hypothetical protein
MNTATVEFVLASKDDLNDVIDFLTRHYIPEEPVLTSIGFAVPPDGYLDTWLLNSILRGVIEPLLDNKQSILARSFEDGSLVGIRLGRIVSKKEHMPAEPKWTLNWMMPKRLQDLAMLQHFLKWMHFEESQLLFAEPDAHAEENIYMASALGT